MIVKAWEIGAGELDDAAVGGKCSGHGKHKGHTHRECGAHESLHDVFPSPSVPHDAIVAADDGKGVTPLTFNSLVAGKWMNCS